MSFSEIMFTYSIEIESISTIIITIATVVLATLTAIYVHHTKYMADEMKILREPNVTIDFEVPTYMIILTIGNSGLTPAIDVQFDTKSDISWLNFDENKQGFSQLPIVIEGISYLAPGRTLKFYAGNLGKSSEVREQNVLDLIIHYRSETGKKE